MRNSEKVTLDPDLSQFELITPDVLVPLDAIRREVSDRYARPSSERFINRQTVIQPDGSPITEEAEVCKLNLNSEDHADVSPEPKR